MNTYIVEFNVAPSVPHALSGVLDDYCDSLETVAVSEEDALKRVKNHLCATFDSLGFIVDNDSDSIVVCYPNGVLTEKYSGFSVKSIE